MERSQPPIKSTSKSTTTVPSSPPSPPPLLLSLPLFNKPFLSRVRGVFYSPSPIGLSLSPSSSSSDLYTDPYEALHQRDLPLIQAMGANTVRIQRWEEARDHTPFLNQLQRHKLYALLPFSPASPSSPFSSSSSSRSEDNFDLSDDRMNQWLAIEKRFRTNVLQRYQSHGSTLAYVLEVEAFTQPSEVEKAVGNERQLNQYLLKEYYRLATRLTAARDEECWKWWKEQQKQNGTGSSKGESGQHTTTSSSSSSTSSSSSVDLTSLPCYHPLTLALLTSSSSTDPLLPTLLPLERRFPTAFDLYSFEVYRGNTFAGLLAQYGRFQKIARIKKPCLVIGFGMDSLDFRVERLIENKPIPPISSSSSSSFSSLVSLPPQLSAFKNESLQSHSFLSLLSELSLSSSSVCVGGIIHEWSDEWWRAGEFHRPIADGCKREERGEQQKEQEESKTSGPKWVQKTCGRYGWSDDEFYSAAYFGLVSYPTQSFASMSGIEDKAFMNATTAIVYPASNPYLCIEPKQSYVAILQHWTGKTIRVGEVCQQMNCCAYEEAIQGYAGAIVAVGVGVVLGIYAWKRRRERNKGGFHWGREGRSDGEKEEKRKEASEEKKVEADSTAMMNHRHNKQLFLLSSSSPSDLLSQFRSLLSPHFFLAFSSSSSSSSLSTLTSHPLGFFHHISSLLSLLSSLFLCHYLRCEGDVTIAVDRFHSRTFESYKAWCKKVGGKERWNKRKERYGGKKRERRKRKRK